MSEALAIAELDTDVLEAALFGSEGGLAVDTKPESDAESKPAPEADEQQSEPVEQELEDSTEETTEADSESESVDVANEGQASDDSASENAESEQVVFRRSSLPQDEARALELRERNPDMSLEAALHMARTELGLYRNDGLPQPVEPTVQDRINEIEAKLAEAGANDGLFTSEIASLTKEHARLCADLAVERAEAQRVGEARLAEHGRLREESYQRAANLWPEATDYSTDLGKAVLAVIQEAEATNNPLLYDPQAPELFVALANARLPENLRVEMKRPAVVKKPTTSGVLPGVAQAAPESGPRPANVLPVRAGARTAQPSNQTLIDPSNIGRAIKEMPTEELEAALLGESGSTALFRL